jgi:cytochrome c oxidase subunit I+III
VAPPPPAWPAISAVLTISSVLAIYIADRLLPRPGERNIGVAIFLLVSTACLVGALLVEIIGHWNSGLRPTDSAYAAMVYMSIVLNGQLTFAIVVMALFAIARYFTGQLDAVRCVTLENTSLLVAYTAGQSLFGLFLIHAFPRILG